MQSTPPDCGAAFVARKVLALLFALLVLPDLPAELTKGQRGAGMGCQVTGVMVVPLAGRLRAAFGEFILPTGSFNFLVGILLLLVH